METLYKLTDAEGYTRRGCSNETKWEIGSAVSAKGEGGLCTAGVIHAYRHPLLAALLNPVHGDFRPARYWRAEAKTVIEEKADKIGVKALTILEEIAEPQISQEARVRFAIGCALEVYSDPQFVVWAVAWLNNTDRSAVAGEAARAAAAAAAWAVEAAAAAVVAAAAAWAVEAAAVVAAAAASAATAARAATAAFGWQRLLAIAEWALTDASLTADNRVPSSEVRL